MAPGAWVKWCTLGLALHLLVANVRGEAPFVDALIRARGRIRAPFFLPGHRLGSALPAAVAQAFAGCAPLDLPELPELGNLFSSAGPLEEAQRKAAQVFRARRTWFLANGSSSGVISAICACVATHAASPGAGRMGPPIVLVPRNAHKCVIHALVICGARAVWMPPEVDEASGIAVGVDIAGTLTPALELHGTSIAAVVLVSPTYEGVVGDIAAAATVCEAHGVALIVDGAHGAHLDPHGPARPDRPPSALACGAHFSVESTHKTLGALSQAAMLHAGPLPKSWDAVRRAAVDRKVRAHLDLITTASPSALLLASLDAVTQEVATAPRGLTRPLRRALGLARVCRRVMQQQPERYPRVVGFSPGPGCQGVDGLRLTIDATGLGGGYAVDEVLIDRHGVYAELPTLTSCTFVFGPGTTAAHARLLLHALADVEADGRTEAVAGRYAGRTRLSVSAPTEPRDAFYGSDEALPVDEAIGRVCAEQVFAYPPGIPIMCVGEEVTASAVDYLGCVLAGGGEISASDSTGATLRVLRRAARA